MRNSSIFILDEVQIESRECLNPWNVCWTWILHPWIYYNSSSRFYKSLSEKGKSYVTTGVVLPSKVVNLVIKRPPNFSFKPGDYIFLNIPSIAYFEWHPFTISSAPEQTDTISLHIRAVGHWTNSLYQVYSLTLPILVYWDQSLSSLSGLIRTEYIV